MENRKLTKEEIRENLRNMFKSLGVNAERITKPRQIVVEDEDGNVIESRWMHIDEDENGT